MILDGINYVFGGPIKDEYYRGSDGEIHKIEQPPKETHNKSLRKYWRSDIGYWEEKRLVLWIIPYYVYTIRKGNDVTTYKRLFKHSKPVYIKKARPKAIIYIGKQEFKTKYNGHKWLFPTNYKLDLKRS